MRYDDWKFKTSKVRSTTMTKQGGSAELSAERFGWRLCQIQLEKRGTTICTSVWRLTCRVGRLLVLRLLTLAIPWHCMRAVTKWHKWSLKNVIIHVNLVFALTLPNCFQKIILFCKGTTWKKLSAALKIQCLWNSVKSWYFSWMVAFTRTRVIA